ncbi:MAG: type II toxin-antitoxin system RelE/ParE family toxin [Candidatus Blackburnbacteria bacterium]|nr:type II toxin-antitoxin system RelE/ParE family toxin [Candidatus Blackburnbacteria bacterium]
MRLIVTPKALRQLARLPKSDQVKVKKKFFAIEKNPFLGKKLGGELAGQYSLRVWPYRVLYIIEEGQGRIYVVSVIHRQGAYK